MHVSTYCRLEVGGVDSAGQFGDEFVFGARDAEAVVLAHPRPPPVSVEGVVYGDDSTVPTRKPEAWCRPRAKRNDRIINSIKNFKLLIDALIF